MWGKSLTGWGLDWSTGQSYKCSLPKFTFSDGLLVRVVINPHQQPKGPHLWQCSEIKGGGGHADPEHAGLH